MAKLIADKRIDERPRLEGDQIFHPLPHTDELHGYSQLLLNRDHYATPSRPVEFRQDDPSDPDGIGEDLRLSNGVLAGRCIHDQEDLVDRSCLPIENPDDLAELFHQVAIAVESPSCIDDDYVGSRFAATLIRRESH